MGDVALRVLGPLEAQPEGGAVVRRFRSRSAAMMLAFLGLSISKAVTRDQLAGAIWPDSEPDLAKTSVRTALHALKSALGDGAIQADRQFIWLNSEVVHSDLARFQDLVSRAQLSNSGPEQIQLLKLAVGLVRGPMLQEIDAWWLAPHQLAFEESFGQAVSSLVKALAEAGRTDEALAIGRHALTVAPLRQDIHVALISVLNLAGRGDEAVHQFEILESLLEENWGESPSPEALQALDLRPPKIQHAVVRMAPLQDAFGRVIYGRASLVDSTCDQLADPYGPKVLTLHGVGGVGKTTVANAILQKLRDEVAVVKIDLVPLRDETMIVQRVAEGFDLNALNIETLVSLLHSKRQEKLSILYLDNAEHLVESVGHIVKSIISNVPGLKCLITSRTLLSIPGEMAIPVRSLESANAQGKLSEIISSPTIALFESRAASASPGFSVTSQNAKAVIEICRILEGHPLAIELAAAHMSVFSPAQLLLRLSDSKFVLKGLVGPNLGRHSSLDAVADESYQLLDSDSQKVWRRLSVFRGSFNVNAAEMVADVRDCAARLARLVSASLLERIEKDNELRFRFLVPLRTFALERLEVSGETQETRDRHRMACLETALRIRPQLDGPAMRDAITEFELWENDFLQVIDLTVRDQRGFSETLLILERISQVIITHGTPFLWAENFRKVLSQARQHVEPMVFAKGLLGHALICIHHQSNWRDAITAATEALNIFESQATSIDVAYLKNVLGLACLFAIHRGDRKFDEAEKWLTEAFAEVEANQTHVEGSLWSDSLVKVAVRSNLAWLHRERGETDEALQFLHQALAISEEFQIVRVTPILMLGLADVYLCRDELENAYLWSKQTLALSRRYQMEGYTCIALVKCWAHCLFTSRYREAYEIATEYSELAPRRTLPVEYAATVLTLVALGYVICGDLEEAKKCWAVVLGCKTHEGQWSREIPVYQRTYGQLDGVEPQPFQPEDESEITAMIQKGFEDLQIMAVQFAESHHGRRCL
ncbi:MAG TPA: BTAD domain-containing putative transcriptional regulator [Fimbriimonadaceae bacterium]|nr:BTAD domain-containing putative transcriptional regulator [Fimbriimonadaceae bacterium]HRJ33641.1 BTAD domain-containing putative transcriptional regulator [Fimbriimonadaceae bacterium]